MNLTKEELDIKLSEGFTGMIDFYADWCGPCKALNPVLERLTEELGGGKIYKVNIDQESELSIRYGIRSVPTLMFFKDGQLVNRTGNLTKTGIMEQLNS